MQHGVEDEVGVQPLQSLALYSARDGLTAHIRPHYMNVIHKKWPNTRIDLIKHAMHAREPGGARQERATGEREERQEKKRYLRSDAA